MRWIGTAVFAACIALLIVKPAFAENYAFLVAVQDYDVKDLKKL